MSDIKPIETRYAGCRFRSRLEARWAVFFDRMKLAWRYEPQGYPLGDGTAYLPDFWLPGPGVWVEVKGAPTEADVIKLYHAAAVDGLPLAYESDRRPVDVLDVGAVTRIPSVPRVLILGEVPRTGQYGWTHPLVVLSASGPMVMNAYFFWSVLDVVGYPRMWPPERASFDGCQWESLAMDTSVAIAYDAARSARFEHGEEG